MLKIVLKFKDRVLKTIRTDKPEITIGRSDANDIRIDNLGVSKHHARLLREKQAYLLEDLASTNGTFVNNQKITRVELQNNDVITIGKHEMAISYIDAPETADRQDFGDKTIRVKT